MDEPTFTDAQIEQIREIVRDELARALLARRLFPAPFSDPPCDDLRSALRLQALLTSETPS